MELTALQRTRDCVSARGKADPEEDDDFARVQQAVKDVKMDMSIIEPESRVWTLRWNYRTALEAAGLADIPQERPHVAIRHILHRIKPRGLRRKMKDLIAWRKNEEFDNKDYGAFIREVAKKAKEVKRSLYESGQDALGSDSDGNSSDSEPRRPSKSHRKPNKSRKSAGKELPAPEKAREDVREADKDSKRPKRDYGESKTAPKCLNPDCSVYHLMN